MKVLRFFTCIVLALVSISSFGQVTNINYYANKKGNLYDPEYIKDGSIEEKTEYASQKVIEEFEKSLQEKAISSIVLEKITAGQNHAEIGGLIAKKWNFPKEVSLTIQYHHYPETAPTEVKKLSTVVYFANMLANYQEHIVEYYQFNQSVLSVFGIENENQLKAISDKLNKVFTN